MRGGSGPHELCRTSFRGHTERSQYTGYIVWNAMLGYKITDDIDLQFNIKNITDRYYYDASYYADPAENHVIPGPGRTFTVTTSFRF